MDMNLSKLQEIVKDGEPGHDLATKQRRQKGALVDQESVCYLGKIQTEAFKTETT